MARERRREDVTIYMEILACLDEGPKGPTRLAQACNLNYASLNRFIPALEGRSYIAKSTSLGRESLAITVEGHQLVREWMAFVDKIGMPRS